MLHSIYDLTTFCRKTTGDVPAKLVGASTTVVGSKMYLFGGRLVTERKMVSDLYLFDLETFNWEKILISPDDDVPRARYFHSADAWNDKLIIFGGMSNQPDSINPDELCVLNDVRFFDITTKHWLPAQHTSVPVPESLLPRARYAHLSSVTADRLFIIGGQDFNNTWLDDVCVYDLLGKSWVQRRDYPRHCGTYRSVAVSSNMAVRLPQEEMRNSQSVSTLGPPGQRFGQEDPNSEYTPTESLIHLPYSAPPSEDYPSDIYLYSNYNFTDVKRELEVFSPLPDTDFTIQDKSSSMTGNSFPPGLRFPTGAILGTYLIIAGTYLAHSYQSFSIWVLDLITMTWSRIDPGKAVETGSWFRGSLWAEANKFIIFGNRNGNLVDDYNRRLLSWDHVAVVDLEAFGIYQPPLLKLDITMQELGLAALEERVVADFDVICDDGRKISVSRKILEERWPWFLEARKKFTQKVKHELGNLPESVVHVPLPELPGNATGEDPPVDPRLAARSLELSESYPITLALMQYFYTTALVTPLQHAPAVLSQLLVLSTNYGLQHLESLVKHAMHRALSNPTSVGVYEVATLCNCRSLQIRALKTVMAYTQKKPSRSRGGDKDSRPPGSGPGDNSANGPDSGTNDSINGSQQYAGSGSRPRGTSDARWHAAGEPSNGSASYNEQNNNVAEQTHTFSSNLEPGYIADIRVTVGLHCAGGSQPNINFHDRDISSNLVTNHITSLPKLPARSQRRPRPQSIVSIRTDSEIHELADYLSEFTAAESTGHGDAGDRSDSLVEHYSPSILHHRQDSYAFSRRDSVSSPSVAPSLSTSVMTLSDSDHHSDRDRHEKHDYFSPSAVYHRHRPLRIYTDLTQSTPSLTSSPSHSSSLSATRYPNTPFTSSSEYLAFDLGIIDEQFDDTHLHDDVDIVDDSDVHNKYTINMSTLMEHRPKLWPGRRFNSRRPLDSPDSQLQPSPAVTPTSTLASPFSPVAESTASSPLLPAMPRTPSGSPFARLLSRNKSTTFDKRSTPAKEKKKKEKKISKETPEQKKERSRKQKLRNALASHPMVMGGMMAIG